MIRGGIDTDVEQLWLRDYLGNLPISGASREVYGERIRRTCDEVRSMQPGESLLAHTRDTHWISAWTGHTRRIAAVTRADRVALIARWWTWLFDCKRIDDNVLGCFHPCSEALQGPPVTLHHNLQRLIGDFIDERGPRRRETGRGVMRLLHHFNVFVHRKAPSVDDFNIDEDLILAWLRHLAKTKDSHSLNLAAGRTRRFLDYLVDKRHLAENPFRVLRKRSAVSAQEELVARLVEQDKTQALRERIGTPRFVSALGPHLDAFIALKRAMGRRYEEPEKDLRRFDRVAARFQPNRDVITKDLVDAWLAAGQHLQAGTRRNRVGLVRQFCLYLVRLDPRTYVPERRLAPARIPDFKPYIYSADEIRALLRAALEKAPGRDPLLPRTLYTALLILYATGLRSGEALALRLRDVDLQERTLLIRETKFFKSRIVPFSNGLGEAIAEFMELRRAVAPSPDSFLFLNFRGRPYSVGNFAMRFHELQRAGGVPHRHSRHQPRVHDTRHTFAVTNVLRWYQEGRDVMAMLPLLATYMGHVDVLSTQHYLRATPELLREASQRFERAHGSLVTAAQEVVDEI